MLEVMISALRTQVPLLLFHCFSELKWGLGVLGGLYSVKLVGAVDSFVSGKTTLVNIVG